MTTRTTTPPAIQPRSGTGLSKSRLIAWKQCPRRLWLEVNRPDLRQVDATAQARFDLGHRVGELARDLVTDGLLIGAEDDLAAALDTTAQALHLTPGLPLFEPAFQHDGVLVRIDLLLPEDEAGSRHHLVEVKSTGSVKDYHLPDAAIQAWVAHRSGLDLARVSLAHLDTSFVYPGGGDYRGLFHQEDVTGRIDPHLAAVPDWIAQARQLLAGPEPDIAPDTQPFQAVPFQWSCHIQHADGQLAHADFLDTRGELPLRPFAASLLATLGTRGPILVYSGYEKRILNELAQALPDLAPALAGRTVTAAPGP